MTTLIPRKHVVATYRTWCAMRERCLCPTNPKYPNYGGRGITICDEWGSFDQFLSDMGERPSGTSLDRIDNNSGYCKNNCRWATKKQQMRNTRRTVFVTALNRSMAMSEACEELGLNYKRVRTRILRGWPVELALNTPMMANQYSLRTTPRTFYCKTKQQTTKEL